MQENLPKVQVKKLDQKKFGNLLVLEQYLLRRAEG